MTDEREERMDRSISTADMVRAAEMEDPQSHTAERARDETRQHDQPVPLLSSNVEEEFRSDWTTIQTKFVDDPRLAVQEADALVASLMKRIAGMFAEERARLEEQWNSGDDVSIDTESLRLALQHYRSFFHRLLSL